MKKKFVFRIASALTAAVIGVGAVCIFAACTSDHPEVTITYSFNGNTYDVDYVLSRKDTPETTQHFIELADAGFYDGTVIHDYNANYLYGGGYYIENGELKEKDYFAEVKKYEEEHSGFKFTQTVYKTDRTTPLYTVVGEFTGNDRSVERPEYSHGTGALVMYYNNYDEKNFGYDICVERADGGRDNDGDPYDTKKYLKNSATSLFYTFLGESDYTRQQNYAVFGKAKDYTNQLLPLVTAINEYSAGLPEEKPFATPYDDQVFSAGRLFLYSKVQGDDPDFEELRLSAIEAEDFETPIDMPIYVTSVKVTKY